MTGAPACFLPTEGGQRDDLQTDHPQWRTFIAVPRVSQAAPPLVNHTSSRGKWRDDWIASW